MPSLDPPWTSLASRQLGVLARRQLRTLGVSRHLVRSQVRAGRWQQVGSELVITTTGELTRGQLMWAGVLHAGRGAVIGGYTALESHRLDGWRRDPVTVLVPKSVDLDPIPNVDFVETRRPVSAWRSPNRLPMLQVEPAALICAAYEPVTRTAYGLLTACVQQRLTTPSQLGEWIGRMRPLRRAKPFRRLLAELADGVQSLSEREVARLCREHGLAQPVRQARRVDAEGRTRYLDCEWCTADGRRVVLEVDGRLHMEVRRWEDDLARERSLVAGGDVVLRCTTRQLRDEGAQIARDLRLAGVPRA